MPGPFDQQSAPAVTRSRERSAPADPYAVLRGRMLVLAGHEWVGRAYDPISVEYSGLIVSGAKAEAKVGELRAAGHGGVLLADPGFYADHFATEDAPFHAEDNGQDSLFSMALNTTDKVLNDAIVEQLGREADYALSPTGYIRAEDSGAFKAAARAITQFASPRMIFVVPLDVAWLGNSYIAQTIAILRDVPGVKALVLGAQKDPLESKRNKVVANLCRLLAEVPDVAVLRTDIAAVGALAHGAAFTGFGVISKYRHLVPPRQDPESSEGGGFAISPHVLHPQLMSFHFGNLIADRYADGTAPPCDCDACGNRLIDRFTTRGQGLEREAIAHNITLMTNWSTALASPLVKADPGAWWRERCATAVRATEEVNARLLTASRNAFNPCPQLAQWAVSGLEQSVTR